MQQNVLKRIHVGHLGMERSKRRARQTCYWPKMNQEIEQIVKCCKTCQKHGKSNSRSPLKPPPLPTRPWEKVGTDLFHLKQQTYIVITDYYSLYPEVYSLPRPDAAQVIEVVKDAFARHGIPTELVSDNGSQYKSYKFKQFAKEWEFQHTTSSPYYPQSNGLAESSVKTVKRTIKKALESGQDIKQSLLILRNSPLKNGHSPAELLMGRKLQDNLPSYRIQPKETDNITRNLKKERQVQKQYFDKTHHTTKPGIFRKGQIVAIQNHRTKEWTLKGTITAEIAPRSYQIKLNNGNITRRNTKNIKKVHALTVEGPNPMMTPIAFTEQGNNELSDSDEDSDTIPYDEDDTTTDDATEPYMMSDEDETEKAYVTHRKER